MTILSVVRDVCAAVGVAIPPTSVFASLSANRTMQEMVSLANEMAQRIAYDTRDWRRLQTYVVYSGDGIKTNFPLPADYKRMLLTSNVWHSTNTQQPMVFVADTDEWLTRRVANLTTTPGEWILLGGDIFIAPVLAVGQTARFPYLHKNCVELTSSGYGDRFMNDNDTFVLDERLLKLGMIWQWKALKGSPYAEDMGTYSDAIANAMGRDKPSPIIIGRKPISQNIRADVSSWSWPLGGGMIPPTP